MLPGVPASVKPQKPRHFDQSGRRLFSSARNRPGYGENARCNPPHLSPKGRHENPLASSAGPRALFALSFTALRTTPLAAHRRHRVSSSQLRPRTTNARRFTPAIDSSPADLARKVNNTIAQALQTARAYPAVKVRTAGNNTHPDLRQDWLRSIESWRIPTLALESKRDVGQVSEPSASSSRPCITGGLRRPVARETWKKIEDEAINRRPRRLRSPRKAGRRQPQQEVADQASYRWNTNVATSHARR